MAKAMLPGVMLSVVAPGARVKKRGLSGCLLAMRNRQRQEAYIEQKARSSVGQSRSCRRVFYVALDLLDICRGHQHHPAVLQQQHRGQCR
jgi:hypothetical protein